MTTFLYLLPVSFALGLFLVGWALHAMLFKYPPNYRDREVVIGGKKFRVDVADTLAKRTRGLSGREPLGPAEGMLFIFPFAARYKFWMKDMKFPIDIIWIRKNKIVGLSENVPVAGSRHMVSMPVYKPPAAIDMALEVKAGSGKEYGLKAEDSIAIER